HQCRGPAHPAVGPERPGPVPLPPDQLRTGDRRGRHGRCQYLHSHRNIPPHDPHMRHGDVRRLQGRQRAQARSQPTFVLLSSSSLSLPQQHAAWIIPFFCYQIFDFVLNTLVAISVVVYPNTVQDYLQQLVRTFSPPLFHSFNAESNPGFLSVPAWNVPLQRGHHVHQQHVPSFRSPHLHRMHPLLQSLPDRLRVELLPIRERPGFHRGAGVRHHQRHHGSAATVRGGRRHPPQRAPSPVYGGVRGPPGGACALPSPSPGAGTSQWLPPLPPGLRPGPGWVPGPGPGAVPPNTPSRLSLHFSTSTSTASNC
ncbi:unnamed protein product, partial [Tetraodon nigroviridis]